MFYKLKHTMRHKKRSALTAEVRDIRARIRTNISLSLRVKLYFRLAFLYLEVLQIINKKQKRGV